MKLYLQKSRLIYYLSPKILICANIIALLKMQVMSHKKEKFVKRVATHPPCITNTQQNTIY